MIGLSFSHLLLTLCFLLFYLKILLDAEMIKRNSNYCLSFFRVFIFLFFFLIQRIEDQNAKTKKAKINLKLSLSMIVVGLAKPCLKQKEGINQCSR